MSSKQPRKERKTLYIEALHKRQKRIAATLSESLRKKHDRRSLNVRRGDTVQLMRGDSKGRKGKVIKVDLKRGRIFVEGITVQKADGTERPYPIHPTNVMILKAVSDERRKRKA
ncbi:MAG: 50S ribosomal protein L24 [Candidatus Hydrothermarchaeaceae archaeon]